MAIAKKGEAMQVHTTVVGGAGWVVGGCVGGSVCVGLFVGVCASVQT